MKCKRCGEEMNDTKTLFKGYCLDCINHYKDKVDISDDDDNYEDEGDDDES